MSTTTITPEEVQKKISQGRNLLLIDVRTPAEFREVHATAARNVPLDRLGIVLKGARRPEAQPIGSGAMQAHPGDSSMQPDEVVAPRVGRPKPDDLLRQRLEAQQIIESHEGASDEPLYVICHSGSRGRQACEKIRAAGFHNVVNVEGGTQAWVQAKLPVQRGKQTISLERQVRIAAGSIVVISAVLALTVHVAFAGLAALVGAGLVFAGITDTCGMGMLLARMPWNRAGEDASCCQVDNTSG